MINQNYHIFEDSKNKVFQIRSKNDIIVAEFTNEIEKEIFKEIVEFVQKGNNLRALNDVKNFFSKKYPEENILNVIKELKEYKVWDEDDELAPFAHGPKEQVQFWRNSDYEGSNDFQEKISAAKISIIGNSRLSELILNKSKESGFETVSLHDTPDILLNDNEILINELLDNSDLLLIDAENWNPGFLELFNKLAFTKNKPWILIRGIDNATGSVGPLFLGRSNGCYHCFNKRLKSNLEYLPYFQEYEKYLKNNGYSSKGSAGPIVFYDLLANIVVLEMIKFISEWTLSMIYKAFLTIDMYTYEFKIHSFLKAPVCPVCSPKVDFKPAPWLEPIKIYNEKAILNL